MAEKTCKERVREHYRDRIADIRKLWNLYREDPEAYDDDLGRFNEYGLSFDYVAPGTFTDQRRGYWQWVLSTGGPGDEFRFFCDEHFRPTKIEYWFLDWFDGAHISVTGKGRELLDEIWDDWRDCGVPQHAMTQAKG